MPSPVIFKIFLMRPSIFIYCSLSVDIFTNSSIMFLDLISTILQESIIINIICIILYAKCTLKIFYKSFLSIEVYLLLFCPCTKPSKITLILSTQINIFLGENLNFSGKCGDFFFGSLMKKQSKTGILAPSPGN